MKMNLDLEVAKLQRSADQYRAMLRDVLMSLGVSKSMEVLGTLEKEFNEAESTAEKLYAHAAMVGVAVTLFDHMQAELERCSEKRRREGK